MKRPSRRRLTGRTESGSFSRWPHACHEHPNYQELSFPAQSLLVDLLYQYRGRNNGDLCCAWGIVGKRWQGARNTLDRAEAELLARGWIVRTREGSRTKPHLYALTMHPVDECGGKLDAGWKPGPALGYWKIGANPLARPPRNEA